MRAVEFRGPGKIEIVEVPDPVVEKPTDAVVRIEAAGVCGSDLWQYRGLEPLPVGERMGHEFIGSVESIGSAVTSVRPGDCVVAPFSYSDGDCAACAGGLPVSCPAGGVWGDPGTPGGAQAEAIRVPFADATLVRLPGAELSASDIRRFLPLADVLPTGHHAASRAGVGPATRVVVIGDGPVAACAGLAARRLGAEQILVLGHHPSRLAVSRAAGMAVAEVGGPEAAAELVLGTFGRPADAVLECVGTQDSVDAALSCVRDGGTLSYVGWPTTGVSIPLRTTFDRNITVCGGLAPVRNYLPELLADVVKGTMDPSSVIDLELPLAAAADAYAAMDQRTVLKACLRN
ncbi:alcohol dehydrogenase catalytic domain-containing protein [Streptomyces rhizosphaerihabitans]|uniref:alcohol dehydrogenase catalytic domain-containing protein n=1 Tax=Streptomyces rhizosphaerihabitans TaxID=1266770 RepID=UPI0021BF9B6B|nr:alcohol dehydrogenase catalytic domain-containing protein [Streptomyces rhizosphaerihabitans]MCT9006107.1 alcohol dehydrogenase catalytic domain-containing protein [Streptomyces rhizosphaerihabitans]